MTATVPVPAVSMVATPGTWRPTALQELVLEAALSEPARAEDAFLRWADATGFDAVDGGSYRILPLVAQRFAELGIVTPWSAHLRGILRRCWYENQVILHAALPAVDILQSAGIDVVVFKGGSLGALAYDGIGARPMQDLDVLVPEERAADALTALLGAGWQLDASDVPPAVRRGELPEPFRRLRPGAPLHGPDGFDVDLHWHATHAWCWPDADHGLWATTRPLEIHGRSVRALAASDELIVACVHGLRPNPVPPIRWVADTVMLLRSEPMVWDSVVSRARELLVEPHLALAFEYVRNHLDAPIPAWVITALRERTPGYFEQQWLDSRIAGGATRSMAALYGHYLRGARADTGFRRLAGGLPDHLVYLLGCDTRADLPAEVGRRALTRVRRHRTRRNAA